jgi:hypothetical protein
MTASKVEQQTEGEPIVRTFIFGAGASLHAGYPLASDLWREMERWTRGTFAEQHAFREAVETMNAEFDLSKSLELVLTDLDSRIDSILAKPRRTREECDAKAKFVDILRPAVKAMIPAYFDSLRQTPAELYRLFANDVLMPGDAVITFNYDMAVDRELRRAGKWSIGEGYGFGIGGPFLRDSPCKLLKLHGSVNWLGQLFQGRSGFGQVDPLDLSLGQRPIIDRSSFEYLGYTNMSDPLQGCNGPVVQSLIMPTANKRFFQETSSGRQWESFWDGLWCQAGKALRASNEVYLIGYSIPEFDVRAREMLVASVETAAIKVCCRRATGNVIDSLKRLVHAEVQPACATDFEGWISCMNGT